MSFIIDSHDYTRKSSLSDIKKMTSFCETHVFIGN